MSILSNKIKTLSIGTLMMIGLSACSDSPQPNKENTAVIDTDKHPIRITGTNVGGLILGTAAQTIHIANDNGLQCSATWRLDDLNPDILKSLMKTEPTDTTAIKCIYQYKQYRQSSDNGTGLALAIISNNPIKKTARLIVGFEIMNVTDNNPEFLKMDPIAVVIKPEFYELIF